MSNKKEYHWNPDTIAHFKFESAYLPKKLLRKNVWDFVEADCTWEADESPADLVHDLISKIYEEWEY